MLSVFLKISQWLNAKGGCTGQKAEIRINSIQIRSPSELPSQDEGLGGEAPPTVFKGEKQSIMLEPATASAEAPYVFYKKEQCEHCSVLNSPTVRTNALGMNTTILNSQPVAFTDNTFQKTNPEARDFSFWGQLALNTHTHAF